MDFSVFKFSCNEFVGKRYRSVFDVVVCRYKLKTTHAAKGCDVNIIVTIAVDA